jgi:hypothetical protein
MSTLLPASHWEGSFTPTIANIVGIDKLNVRAASERLLDFTVQYYAHSERYFIRVGNPDAIAGKPDTLTLVYLELSAREARAIKNALDCQTIV